MAHLGSEKSGSIGVYFVPVTTGFKTGVQTQKLFPAVEPGVANQVAFAPSIQYPISRGSVHITSAGMLVIYSWPTGKATPFDLSF